MAKTTESMVGKGKGSRIRAFIARFTDSGQQTLIFLVETVKLRYYLITFGIVIIGCGYLYSVLTPLNQGVQIGGGSISHLSILNGIYFSIVTISSLGYGDIHPIGLSKAIACFEVLFGLSVMGLVIAKATSGPLAHHVRQLFNSDAQRKLDGFSVRFTELASELLDIMKGFSNVYQNAPGKILAVDNKEIMIGKFRKALLELYTVSTSLSRYFSLEASYSKYFSIVSSEAIRRVGDSVDKTFFQLGQLITSLTPEAKAEVLDGISRQQIAETISIQQVTCRTVHKHSDNSEINSGFGRVLQTCESVLDYYFATPVAAAVLGQPDQKPADTGIPQAP